MICFFTIAADSSKLRGAKKQARGSGTLFNFLAYRTKCFELTGYFNKSLLAAC